MNEWLQAAPLAQPLCTVVAALVNVTDFAIRAPRWMQKATWQLDRAIVSSRPLDPDS